MNIIIGLLIFRLAVKLFIINFNYLVGKIPSESFIDEIKDIAETEGKAELVCHFCNKKYNFEKEDLERLISE